MPICNITLSENVELSSDQLNGIRVAVGKGMNSRRRHIDDGHIVFRFSRGRRDLMLAELELDIYAQLYLCRFLSRDRRCVEISSEVAKITGFSCAT